MDTDSPSFPAAENKVRCKNCDHYDPIIHSCERIDREAGAFVSYVFDDCWCFTEEGAKPITDEEFKRKWYGMYGEGYSIE